MTAFDLNGNLCPGDPVPTTPDLTHLQREVVSVANLDDPGAVDYSSYVSGGTDITFAATGYPGALTLSAGNYWTYGTH